MNTSSVTDKQPLLTRTPVVCLTAMLCCLLWGSAFPSIKIGYKLFAIKASDTGSQLLFAGIRFALAGGHLQGFTVASVLLLLYMALISAVAYTLWGLLLKHNPVSRISVYGFMNPVCGVVLSAVLLQEKNQAFSLIGLISLILVCIGIYIVNRKKRDSRA